MTKSGFEFAMTLAAVRKLSPCRGSYERVSAVLPKRGKITAAQAREAGCTFDDMTWLASGLARVNPVVERRVRHWNADCAAHVLHIYEREYPNDSRPRDAINACRDFADGKIDAAAGAAAGAAARAAAWDAARAAARAAAWATAGAAEERWQFDRLVLWLSEEEPTPFDAPALEQAA